MPMRLPRHQKAIFAQCDRNVGAAKITEPGRQIANERDLVGSPIESDGQWRSSRIDGGRRIPRNVSEERSQQAERSIEFRRAIHLLALHLPQIDPGTYALVEADHQKTEHSQRDQYL